MGFFRNGGFKYFNLVIHSLFLFSSKIFMELSFLSHFGPLFLSSTLRRIYTSGFHIRFLHWVAIFIYLPWLSKTKVSNIKLQYNVVNACRNRMCKLVFSSVRFSWASFFWHGLDCQTALSHTQYGLLTIRAVFNNRQGRHLPRAPDF